MKCLVVDDSELSLDMAVSLLEEMNVPVVGVSSGLEAIEYYKMNRDECNLILMDYRMPEMSGAEATKAIRDLEDKRSVCIVGMSGDTDEDTKKLLLGSGMDGVLGKPLNPSLLMELFQKNGLINKNEIHFDQKAGSMNSGNDKLFNKHLEIFGKLAPGKIALMQEYLETGDIKNYTIEAHALKSNARYLGNMELSNQAAEMEKAGDINDLEYITANKDSFLQLYKISGEAALSSVKKDEISEREPADGELLELLEALSEAIETFDVDSADRIIEDLEALKLPDDMKEDFKKLGLQLADVDFEKAARSVVLLKKQIIN